MKIKDIIQNGMGGPIFYVCVGEHESTPTIQECITKQNYLLVLLSVENWNEEYGLWKASNPMGGEDFGEKANVTLEYIQSIRKQILKDYPNYHNEYIIGYSLAGLFSLWAFYESDIFKGVGACSASLWYDGFEEYLNSHNIRVDSRIYLSVGGKEEKTKNPIVATIGNRYRELSRKYKNDPSVVKTTLVMNPGGHFTSSTKRMAQAIDYLIEND